jgi:hypothetical protein
MAWLLNPGEVIAPLCFREWALQRLSRWHEGSLAGKPLGAVDWVCMVIGCTRQGARVTHVHHVFAWLGTFGQYKMDGG